MDKNTIIGFVLIGAIVIGFSWLNKPTEEERKQKEAIEAQAIQQQTKLVEEQAKTATSISEETKVDQKSTSAANFIAPNESNDSTTVAAFETSPQKDAKIVSLENEVIKIDISTKGAQMISVHPKTYKTFEEDSLYLFNKDAAFSLQLENKSSIKLNTIDALFVPIESKDGSTLTMRLSYSESQHIDFVYTLQPNSYMVKFDINVVGMDQVLSSTSKEKFVLSWQQDLRRQEKSIANEQRHSSIYYKTVGDDVKNLSDDKDVKEEISDPIKWVAFKDQYFASTLISDQKFDISILSSKKLDSDKYLKQYGASLYVTPVAQGKETLHAGFQYFLGPLKYSMLKSYDDKIEDETKQLDLDKMIPLGWTLFRVVNQYFIIPLFNLLNSTGLAMGIVILILTIIVKLIISPLTYKSFMSSAKMRVLRPQIEELNAKFPKQEQAMEKQRATMDLYGKAGVNPMSGCIPMLLQMPILIALFSFFPSAIELRQESFLWANDLSTYDAIFTWDYKIPLIGDWIGNHISLFCILMTVTSIIYTKFNMDATNTGQQQMPGMKWMMYLMPIVFLFVLNNYPSGLTYYYFLSTLITILLTIGFRFVVDEEALLAKLEANKKKPKKKSGFMARIEEAQKMQQQQAKKKAKK